MSEGPGAQSLNTIAPHLQVSRTNVQLLKIEKLLSKAQEKDGGGYNALQRAQHEKMIADLYAEKARLEGEVSKVKLTNKKLREKSEEFKRKA